MHRITIEYGTPADTDSFEKHYAQIHVPLAAKIPGLRRFTTSHPQGLRADAPYMVAELWFDDGDALKAALRSPEMAAAAADAQTFDVASTTTFSGEVTEITLP